MNITDSILGTDLFGDPIRPKNSGVVNDVFTFPPFSVLDARGGDWQERKRAWISTGIKSELGRSASVINLNMRHGLDVNSPPVDAQCAAEYTSIFDPVLCELVYRWFCPPSGQIVDPFAGGSVRGLVALQLGRKYWGSDLSRKQIEANREQAESSDIADRPEWVIGDSMRTIADAPRSDFLFSCPPYGDLEVYSDDPADISGMEWHTFLAAYKRIIMRSVLNMNADSFACFVVGDFRDKKGFYRNFVGNTISAFEEAGARLYNEAILLTPLGGAAMRAKQFSISRKLIKTHQNLLVFCKGDPRKAADKTSD